MKQELPLCTLTAFMTPTPNWKREVTLKILIVHIWGSHTCSKSKKIKVIGAITLLLAHSPPYQLFFKHRFDCPTTPSLLRSTPTRFCLSTKTHRGPHAKSRRWSLPQCHWTSKSIEEGLSFLGSFGVNRKHVVATNKKNKRPYFPWNTGCLIPGSVGNLMINGF